MSSERGTVDWKKFDATTDEDIAQQIASDPDEVPEITDEQFASAVWVRAPKKKAIALRLDPEVLDFFRAQGPGYQSRINAALLSFVRHARKGC